MVRRLAIIGVAAAVTAGVVMAVATDRGDDPGGRQERSASGPPAVRLVPAPRAVRRACRSLAREKTVGVRCPVRLPRARWIVRYRSLEPAHDRYLLDLRSDAGGRHRHVLAGGRRRAFDLRTAGDRWPSRVPRPGRRCCARPGDLGLIGARARGDGAWEPVRMSALRRVRLGSGRPALLLAAAPHPDGGIHGGHVVVVWNQDDHGYVLSFHAARHDRASARDERIAVAAAATVRTTRRAGPTDR